MPTFQRATVVDAPLEDVWAFHSSIDGLRALTPAWSGLEIVSIVGPDGTHPDTLVEGTDIEMRVRPASAFPGPGWTSRITKRDRMADAAIFRDTMFDGPFETWEHTHRFHRSDGQTVVVDSLEYDLPARLRPLTPAVHAGLVALFEYRHRRTRTLLDRD